MALYSKVDRVAWAETDAAGVVHFANYFKYCEDVEKDLFTDLDVDIIAIADKYGIWFPRVYASCSYKWPLRFNQRYRVDLVQLTMKNKSLRYRFEIWNLDEDVLSAECEITVVCASVKEKRAVEIPHEIREILIGLGVSVEE